MTDQKQGTVITFGNFQGGTGKTTNSTMIAYALSEMGYKVLLSDQGPLADATSLYSRTKLAITGEEIRFDKTLIQAIQDEDLGSIITEIKENLYLLPNGKDFFHYPQFLEMKFPNKRDRVQYFSKLIRPLKKEFDFIFIDAPPQPSIINDSALYASNFVVPVLQTQGNSLEGAKNLMGYLQVLKYEYGTQLNIIGILPVLFKIRSSVDLATLAEAKKVFGEEHVFNIVVKDMERLRRFATTGITDNDMYDRRVHELYKSIAAEFISRLNAKHKMERNIFEQSSPAHQFKVENVKTNYKEPEKNSLKKEPISDKRTTFDRTKISHRDKLNALVFLKKADTADDLQDFMIEEYLNTYVTKDEKKKFDILMEL